MQFTPTSSNESTATASWQEWKPKTVENRFKKSDADFMAAGGGGSSVCGSASVSVSVRGSRSKARRGLSQAKQHSHPPVIVVHDSPCQTKKDKGVTDTHTHIHTYADKDTDTTVPRALWKKATVRITAFVVTILSIIALRTGMRLFRLFFSASANSYNHNHSVYKVVVEEFQQSMSITLYSMCWSVAQIIHSIDGKNNKIANHLEQLSWSSPTWRTDTNNSNNGSTIANLRQIRTLSLTCSDEEQLQITMTTNTIHKINDTHFCTNWDSKFEDEVTSKYSNFDFNFDFDTNLVDFLSEPLYILNLASYTSSDSNSDSNSKPMLSLSNLSQSPLGNLEIQYFSDSTVVGALQPNSIAPLNEIVHNITTYPNSTIKIGTQVPVKAYPSLIESIAPVDFVTKLFGDRFRPDDIKPVFGLFPSLTTVPMFLARGLLNDGQGGNEGKDECVQEGKGEVVVDNNHDHDYDQCDKRSENGKNVRTDLHCEPIGNISMQLEGSKKWTLVQPQYSNLLQPTVAKHGRAFFYSSLDPLLNPNAFRDIPHYEVQTNKGDGLWLPPWTWHQIDYIPGEVSFAASLFHFRPIDFFKNNPLFAALIIPNLIKELLGWKTE